MGFLMGKPFPLGLMHAAKSRAVWVPWAWGVNGSASVVGAAAAPLIAVEFGVSAVMLAGLATYLVAVIGFGRGLEPSRPRALRQE